MQVHFTLHYHCKADEHLRLHTKHHAEEGLPLHSQDGCNWHISLSLDQKQQSPLRYGYALWRGNECLRCEVCAEAHCLSTNTSHTVWRVQDSWLATLEDTHLYSQAFVLPQSCTPLQKINCGEAAVCLRASAPALSFLGLALAIVGEGDDLGNWQAENAVLLHEVSPHHWQCILPVTKLENKAYKFVLINADKQIIAWEEGENRTQASLCAKANEILCLPEVQLRFSEAQPHVAGTAIPVFSLRSKGSQGVGDFGDLCQMLDWLSVTGQKALQILPINDTHKTGTFLDSYPYNAISIFALHPLYIDLRQCPPLTDSRKAQHFEHLFRQLNALPDLDYEVCYQQKTNYLRLLFAQEGEAMLESEAFRLFYAQNQDWLVDYARFCVLRDATGTADFWNWPIHQRYDAEALQQWEQANDTLTRQLRFYYFLQYLLDQQLRSVAALAQQRGIILKGDIPIGISPSSVEAWREPELFHMDQQAGAPPDAFATEGQNWGFPTYNWERMRTDGYAWWRRRFSKMADYFTAYRIDHILGFFRIWEIPQHSLQGLLGHFSPALPLSWAELHAEGLDLPKDFMLQAFINDDLLQRWFTPKQREWVTTHCLQHAHHDIWHLRPEWRTQRQIIGQLEQQARSLPQADLALVQRGLLALSANVLFIEDTKQADHFHPRICGMQTQVFERLQSWEKEAYVRLYEDFYYHRHHHFWQQSALSKLPALVSATGMLACGEDLGMVPDCVPWVLQELGILSLEIERMPKAYACEFGTPSAYPRSSVCTIGTHDMSTLRGWWEEDPAASTRYYHHQLGHGGLVPEKMNSQLAHEIIVRHLDSPSLLTILALQDWLALDEKLCPYAPEQERINVPANPQHNWKYRMPLTLENLMAQTEFNQLLRHLTQQHKH